MPKKTAEAGLDGVVCSAQEVATRQATYSDFICLTPGSRPAGAAVGTKRVMTPADAIKSVVTISY